MARALLVLMVGISLLTVTGCYGFLNGKVPAHPQRPLLSNSPETAEHGAMQAETGLLVDRSDLIDTPTVLRYGLTESSEAFLGFSPYRRVFFNRGDDHDQGYGDTTVGARTRLFDETETLPAVAVEMTGKIPTANKASLADGANDQIDLALGATASRTFESDLQIGAYGQLRWLGDPQEPGDSTTDDPDLGFDTTVYGSQPLSDRFSVFGEFGGRFVPTQNTHQLFTTWGLAVAVNPGIILDIGGTLGLNDQAPDFQFQMGITAVLGSHYIQTYEPNE